MLTIAFANRKPGTGKTTSAVWLAHAYHEQGKRVLLVDADPAASAMEWADLAAEAAGQPFPFRLIGLPRRNLHEQLPGFARDTDIVILDLPPVEGGDGPIAYSGMMAAHEIVIPLAPSSIELSRSIPVRTDIAKVNARRSVPARSCVLLNRVLAGTVSLREIRTELERIGFDVLPHSVNRLEMYSSSFAGGVDARATIWSVIASDLTRRANHAAEAV